MKRCWFLIVLTCFLAATPSRADKLILVAGGGTHENAAPAKQARLNQPFGIASDKMSNFYLVELAGERVLKIHHKGNILEVLAGTGKKGDDGDGGPALKASFNGMHSLAVTPDGVVFIADTWNHRVRKIDRAGIITTVAGTGKKAYSGDGGPAMSADLSGVHCIAFDFDFGKLYLTDLDNRRIRVLDLKTGIIDLVAGNGKKGVPEDGADAKASPLVDPRAACVDRQGNLYILERSGHALRVVDPKGKIRTVVGITGKAGDTGDGGDARQATLTGPKHLCVDLDDNVIVADSGNHVVRKYTPKDGKIVRLAGTGKKGQSGDGGEALNVSLDEPHGVYVHPLGNVYIVDSLNHRVFRLEK